MNDTLRNLGKDELVELLEIYAKNLIALDGTWFQSLEREEGMDTAVRHDIEAWRRFSVSEARRIKKFLGLDERPGIEGLARALALRCQSAANVDEILVEGDELTYRIVDCRVQNARKRKGMGVPSLPQRGRGGVRGVRREHRRPHLLRMPELFPRYDGRLLQLRLEVHAESVRI